METQGSERKIENLKEIEEIIEKKIKKIKEKKKYLDILHDAGYVRINNGIVATAKTESNGHQLVVRLFIYNNGKKFVATVLGLGHSLIEVSLCSAIEEFEKRASRYDE